VTVLDWIRGGRPAARHAPLSTEHAARLAEIHSGAFARPWNALEFERLLADRVVVADGLFLGRSAQPSGFALSRVVADEGEILTIALAPEARGQGHARAFLAHHRDELARAGARQVHLEVEEGNVPALTLYRRLGFEEVGRRTGYYARPDGGTATALTMRAVL
jgi:[ribosomal protein S18]-alanine N-acetyltransferase